MVTGFTQERVPERWSVAEYFDLVSRGVLGPEDRVELLEGVVVAMSPQNPRHAAGVSRADAAIRTAIGNRAAVRVQLPLVLGAASAPEPDVAVVPGHVGDYDVAHPTTALLVVEVADASLVQDRITKAAIYAAAAIPEYWILNLLENRIEIHRSPDAQARRYRVVARAERGEAIEIDALPSARVAVDDVIPRS